MILCTCLCGLFGLCAVYVYVCVVMCTSVRVCANACGGWWLAWNAFLSCSPHDFFEIGVRTQHRTH